MANQILPDVLHHQIGSEACYGHSLADNVAEVTFPLITNLALSNGLTRD